MAIEVTMPEPVGGAGNELSLSEWLVMEGATISEGDDLVEVLNDKAALTVPSPVTGRIVEIRVRAGEELEVGDVLCIVEQS